MVTFSMHQPNTLGPNNISDSPIVFGVFDANLYFGYQFITPDLMLKEGTKGYVISVLTGDTLIIKLFEKRNRYAVALLPYACAPQFSMFLNTAMSDPFAIEATNHLREIAEDRIVVLGPPLNYDGPKTFTHQMLGHLPITINKISFFDDPDVDIDALMLQSGYARIRKLNQNNAEPRVIEAYNRLQEDAFVKKIGIWAVPEPLIDPSTENEFDTIVLALNDDFTFRLLEPAIDVEIAGIAKVNTTRIKELNRFIGEKILFHRATVRILQRIPGSPFLISMSIKNFDVATMMIENRFAVINDITSHFLSGEKRLRNLSKLDNISDHEFSVKVTEILSSNSFKADNKVFILSYINVPKFSFKGKSEPFGLEAFRYLRNKILNQTVNIDVVIDNDGVIYGVVKVGSQNINYQMVKDGYASIAKSRIQGFPPNIKEYKVYYDSAVSYKAGMHGNSPNPLNAKLGIIHDIISPTEISIYINGSLKIFELQNLTSQDFSFSNALNAVNLLKLNYLQHDVEIVNGSIIDVKSKEDIRTPILSQGLMTPISTFAKKDLSLSQAEEKGLEKIKIRLNYISKTGINFQDPVIVTNVLSPTFYAVQLQSKEMKQIQTLLLQTSLKQLTNFKNDEVCIANINGKLYRCVIFNYNDNSNTGSYCLVDYGIILPLSVGTIYDCPLSIIKIPQQCIWVSLNNCTSFDDDEFNEYSMRFIWNLFDKKATYDVKVVSSNSIVPKVTMIDNLYNVDIQKALLHNGIIKLKPGEKDPELIAIERECKNKNIGGWGFKS